MDAKDRENPEKTTVLQELARWLAVLLVCVAEWAEYYSGIFGAAG